MHLSGLATRTIAATSALALSVVGFVALPGTAQAAVTPVAPTVSVVVDWSGGDPIAVIAWTGAVTRASITGYDVIFGAGDAPWTVETWNDATCTEGSLDASASTCHMSMTLTPSTDYSFGVSALDVALSGVRGYGTVHVPASDPNAPVDDEAIAYTQRTWRFDVLANDPGDPTTATVVDDPTAGQATWNNGRFDYAVTDADATEDSFTYRNDLSGQTATVHITIGTPTAWVMGDIEVTATGTTTIDVAWAEPDPGTFDLLGYYVYWTSGSGWQHSARITGTEYTIEDLVPATEYTITVKSTDGTNLSGSLRAYATTDPSVPTVPGDFTAEAAGSTRVDLSWTASEFPGAGPDCYDVSYRANGLGDWTWADCTDGTSLTLEGLDPDTDYEFAIVARDLDENSSDQALAYATTDAEPPAPTRPQITTPDAVVTGATATFEVSMVSDDAQIAAGDLADGVAGVDVDGLTVTVTTVRGFSGSIVQPLLVTDGGDPVEVDATVLVNPDPASRATYRIVSATASRVTWTAGAGATGYVVKVGGTSVCTAISTTCLVPRVLGPASIVTVTATGHDGTVGTAARAVWASAPVNLGRVHFVGDSPRFTPTSAAQLRALAAQLLAAGVTRVTVHGYTATQGRATRTPVQMRLSAMRANAVAAYLTAYVTAHGRTLRVVKVAEGATHPAASNATAAGRAENRRAEVVLG